jgi:hypothetical protein
MAEIKKKFSAPEEGRGHHSTRFSYHGMVTDMGANEKDGLKQQKRRRIIGIGVMLSELRLVDYWIAWINKTEVGVHQSIANNSRGETTQFVVSNVRKPRYNNLC